MLLSFWFIGLFCFFVSGYANVISALSLEHKMQTISIVGGVPAEPGEFQNLIILRYKNTLRCGGSLIAPNFVLTAAHCLYGFSIAETSAFSVMANTLNLDGGDKSITRSVIKFIIHERYNPNTYVNDIALLVLDSPIRNVTLISLPKAKVPTTTVKPSTTKATTKKPSTTVKTTMKPHQTSTIKTPMCSCTCEPGSRPVVTTQLDTKRSYSDYKNMPAVIAGWGTTAAGGSISKDLLKANVTVLPNSVCINQYSSNEFFGNTMLCAAAPGKDTCQGDSGGPLFVEGVQVGITSWGYGCAEPNYAGVYTRVTTFVEWIKRTMARNPVAAVKSIDFDL